MQADPTLAELGWAAGFEDQLTADDLNFDPARVTAVNRDRLSVLSEAGAALLELPPGLSAGSVAVGDWVLADPATRRVARVLARKSRIARGAAGDGGREQLIVANVDRVFLVTSCNADFNEARLERFLALAHSGGVPPAILLTKTDKTDQAESYTARARACAPDVPVLALNAKDPAAVEALRPLCGRGQTVAFLGTSGVGKSTLISALIGRKLATADIREDDARGRHTTTARELYPVPGGGWVIDTPGMRELRLADTAEGIDATFAEIGELARACRFSDCTHAAEPGCAVQAAIAEGRLEPARVARWQKLQGEESANQAALTARARRADGRRRTPAKPRPRAKPRLFED